MLRSLKCPTQRWRRSKCAQQSSGVRERRRAPSTTARTRSGKPRGLLWTISPQKELLRCPWGRLMDGGRALGSERPARSPLHHGQGERLGRAVWNQNEMPAARSTSTRTLRVCVADCALLDRGLGRQRRVFRGMEPLFRVTTSSTHVVAGGRGRGHVLWPYPPRLRPVLAIVVKRRFSRDVFSL